MQIVIISDTHAQHQQLGKLEGDVLIHCGDFCDGFKIDVEDIRRIDDWFGTLPFEKIIAIGGNHDFVAQQKHREQQTVFKNATYLVDQAVCYRGITFYGSPWVPELDGWAYYMSHDERKAKWKQIPENTDVLITHTPPLGILDKPRSGQSVGCSHLRARVERLNLKVHCFGHIHASYGSQLDEKTKFYNASVADSQFQISNQPFVIEIDESVVRESA